MATATMSLAQGIREAIEKLGAEAPTEAIKAYITEHHKGLAVTSASFQSSLSGQRQKARGGAAKKGSKTPPKSNPGSTTLARVTSAAAAASPSVNGQVQLQVDLMHLRDLIGTETTKRLVDQWLVG